MSSQTLTRRESETPAKAERVDQTLVFSPRVDIIENDEAILLTAEMPGVDETSVDIALEGQELTITGQCLPQPPKDYTETYAEYTNGNYEREFTLGDTIDRNAIKAVVKDGVLNLTLPKAKEAKPRQIAVKAG